MRMTSSSSLMADAAAAAAFAFAEAEEWTGTDTRGVAVLLIVARLPPIKAANGLLSRPAACAHDDEDGRNNKNSTT